MKKLLYSVLAACAVSIAMFTATSCEEHHTYAKQKKKEKAAIGRFLSDNDFVGPIRTISEAQFYAQDSMTNLDKNEFVRFDDDGIYMQIVRKGNGPTMVELAKEQKNLTVTRPILCKFIEYDIEGADITCSNIYKANINDEMMCTYNHFSRSYQAWYTEGVMLQTYHSSAVPTGWLKPLNFIRLTTVAGEEAKVRLIVPHTSGTTNASGNVLPFYYQITYQMPPNY